MAIIARYTKQPAEYKDYDVDYSEWLLPHDTIDIVATEVQCLTDESDQSLTVESIENTLTRVKLWIRGGTHGRKYKLTITVTTVAGRIDEEEIIFTVKDY